MCHPPISRSKVYNFRDLLKENMFCKDHPSKHHRQSWLEYSPHNDGRGQWIPGREVSNMTIFHFHDGDKVLCIKILSSSSSLLQIFSLQIVHNLKKKLTVLTSPKLLEVLTPLLSCSSSFHVTPGTESEGSSCCS